MAEVVVVVVVVVVVISCFSLHFDHHEARQSAAINPQ